MKTRTALMCSAVGVGCFVAIFLFTQYWFYVRPLSFDSNEWKHAREQKRYDLCYRMSSDLEKKLSGGKITSDEARILLGEPDSNNGLVWKYKLRAAWFTIFPDDNLFSIYFDGIDYSHLIVVKAFKHHT